MNMGKKTFKLDAKVIEALKRLKNKKGIDPNFFVNGTLREALKDCMDAVHIDSDLSILETFANNFKEWVSSVCAINEPYNLSDSYMRFVTDHEFSGSWLTKRQFLLHLSAYCKKEGLVLTLKNSGALRLFILNGMVKKDILSLITVKENDPFKNANDPLIMEWVDKNVKPGDKIYTSTVFSKFVDTFQGARDFMTPKFLNTYIRKWAWINKYTVKNGKDLEGRFIIAYTLENKRDVPEAKIIVTGN